MKIILVYLFLLISGRSVPKKRAAVRERVCLPRAPWEATSNLGNSQARNERQRSRWSIKNRRVHAGALPKQFGESRRSTSKLRCRKSTSKHPTPSKASHPEPAVNLKASIIPKTWVVFSSRNEFFASGSTDGDTNRISARNTSAVLSAQSKRPELLLRSTSPREQFNNSAESVAI